MPVLLFLLQRYFEISQAACQRYAHALVEVNDPRQAYQQVDRLTQPRCRQGRRVRGLNPSCTEDAALFEAVLRHVDIPQKMAG